MPDSPVNEVQFGLAHESYNFQNFTLTISGIESITLQSFDFDRTAELEPNFGKGGEIVSYGIKNFKSTCKATILMEELETFAKLASAWGGDLTKVPPFPINAVATPEGRTPMKFGISMVRVQKFSFGMKQGDSKTEVPIEFFALAAPVITFA